MRTNIGVYELRAAYSLHILTGLLIAGSLHFFAFGGYRMYASLTRETIEFSKEWEKRIITFIPLPPPIENRPVIPNPVLGTNSNISIGIPVPIPEAEINPEATIATQHEMNQHFTGSETGDPNGTLTIPEGTFIIDGEPPPIFVPVEKQPEPINSVFPPYPEIARRAGVEGVVHVKMWITKEGKVKKAEIVKSTSDIFNQVSIEAALRWSFTPAFMNNGPVAVWVTIPFKFRLHAAQ